MIIRFVLLLALIPAVLGGFALFWRKNPPGYVNWAYGYRTRRSMQSQESWDYAHQLCAKLFPRYNLITLIGSEIALLIGHLVFKANVELVAVCLLSIQIVLILLMCLPIDKALKQKFD
jgi:uncharacterized membrane protein